MKAAWLAMSSTPQAAAVPSTGTKVYEFGRAA